MDQHEFVAGPNGLCEKCGKSLSDCSSLTSIYITGLPVTSGQHLNKSIVQFGQLPEVSKLLQISCSKNCSFVLTNLGQLYSWGDNSNALGRALEKKDDSKIPKQITHLRNRFVLSISCGESHVLAVESEKTVWTWGYNKFGQLGLGDFTDRNLPEMIQNLNNIAKVAAGGNFSYAVSGNGRVYAWGDNKNNQLGIMTDENGSKQGRFPEPRPIENAPWDKSADIEVAGGNENNFFYMNKIQRVKTAEISTYEAKMIQLESQELKRKFDLQSKKVAILEEELYKNSLDHQSKTDLSRDTALKEMHTLLKINEITIAELEKAMKNIDEEILRYTIEIKDIEAVLQDLNNKESSYWDEAEQHEVNLIKLKNKKMKEPDKLSEVRTKKDIILGLIKTVENTKSTYYSKLNLKQDLLEQLSKSKSEKELEIMESNKKDVVFRQMISSREKEIQRNFLKNGQETADNDIVKIIKIHEALKQTTIEAISKSVQGSNLMSFISLSNDLLDRLKNEISTLRYESKKSPLKNLFFLWDVVENNADLRKDLNVYTEGLLFHTVNKVSELYSDPSPVPSSRLISTLEYAKQVATSAGITSLLPQSITSSEKSMPLKPRSKPKNRFC